MVFIWSAAIGIIAGLFVGLAMRRKGSSLVINLIAGLIGALLGGWIFTFLIVKVNVFEKHLIMSALGAIVCLWVLSFFKKEIKKT